MSRLPAMRPRKVGFSLFWRTLVLLLLLLACGVFAWLQTLHEWEGEPQAVSRSAQQLASVVRLSEEALRLVDRSNRPALIKAIGAREGLFLQPRTAADAWVATGQDPFMSQLDSELRARLGGNILLATSVNALPGLWVGFAVDREAWWLQAPAALLQRPGSDRWPAWLALALVITLGGSVLIARRINRPLRDLQFAASKIRGGEYDSRLDETTVTSEIREVNMGFNRMARELAKVEEDRAVMLAGISHDLRTPLARIRFKLEAAPPAVKAAVLSDVEQMEQMIGGVLAFIRDEGAPRRREKLDLLSLIECVADDAAEVGGQVEIVDGQPVTVDGDPVALQRLFSNLVSNALKYGGGAQITVRETRGSAVVEIADAGPGLSPDELGRVFQPFYRTDASRNLDTGGVGLGLPIARSTARAHGGDVELMSRPGRTTAIVTLPAAA